MRPALLPFAALLVLPAPALAFAGLPSPTLDLAGAGAANSCVVVLTGSCTFDCDATQLLFLAAVSPLGMVRITCAGRVLFDDHPIFAVSVYSPVPPISPGVGPLRGVGTCEAWGHAGVIVCGNTPLPA